MGPSRRLSAGLAPRERGYREIRFRPGRAPALPGSGVLLFSRLLTEPEPSQMLRASQKIVRGERSSDGHAPREGGRGLDVADDGQESRPAQVVVLIEQDGTLGPAEDGRPVAARARRL